ncbi:hypothetical protein [Puniceibacterium confluentis]|uniref:hypothetical protein n=1 Tax=Puniceibacterium confluentis TaxID=1958944 RepID=UPI0011B3FF0A|nr:hypothetical protein [Puniceibacterium confluentis]
MANVERNEMTTSERGKRKAPRFKTSDPKDVTIELEDADHAREYYGMKSRAAASGVLVSAMQVLGVQSAIYRDFVIALAEDIEPRDGIEAMLVTQMGATHVALAITSERMSDAPNWTLRESYERSMTRLSRTYLAQMDALKKYRAKAQQVVRVERVTVHEGGQAIVGPVTHGG